MPATPRSCNVCFTSSSLNGLTIAVTSLMVAAPSSHPTGADVAEVVRRLRVHGGVETLDLDLGRHAQPDSTLHDRCDEVGQRERPGDRHRDSEGLFTEQMQACAVHRQHTEHERADNAARPVYADDVERVVVAELELHRDREDTGDTPKEPDKQSRNPMDDPAG